MKRVLWLGCVVLGLPLLAACSKPAPQAEETSASVAPPPPVIDPWPGKYEGDLMVRISGGPGAHKVVLVEAEADGCNGDVGLAGGEPARDVSATELSLVLKPDDKTVCTIRIVRNGGKVTVSETGICTAYHGLSCPFEGTAAKVN
ncbi:hypothetical protein [Asticcacaulis sp. 201]|uniref:hypothetical protein n=1 Tax=Asticcacaulis sp. 201 TaxID=3028787 RepID=UPI002915FCAB|nr:hypothetical protein [Asticcacaulis sp. 201]MDV6332104.1 hypothetical protein [Asticcacaulis sp. 201]